jgi:hypothetical protein
VVGLLAAGCFHDDGAGNITTVVTTVVDTVTGDGGDSTVGDPVKPAPGKKIVADQTDAGPPRFKGCHGMSTRAILRTDEPGVILGTTDIWSHCWVGGFTGTVAVTVGDADGDALTWLPEGDQQR